VAPVHSAPVRGASQLYLAHGSNMQSGRLRRRVTSARPVGVARVPEPYVREALDVHARQDPDPQREAWEREVLSP